MDGFRLVVAIFLSCISFYLVADLFMSGFSLPILCAAVTGFVLVHFIWPRHRPSDSLWYELLELVFDLPYRLIAGTLRALRATFKSVDVDIDL